MPRTCTRAVSLVLCICMVAASCTTHRPVPLATPDRAVHLIHLEGPVVLSVRKPQTARWEGDSVVVRDRDGAVVDAFARSEVLETVERRERIGGVVVSGLLVLAGAIIVVNKVMSPDANY